MIRHMLFWTFTEQIHAQNPDETIRVLQQSYANMVGKIPGLRCAEIGKNLAGGPYDIALYCELDSVDDLNAYQTHPLHLELKEMAKNWVEGRVCVDYEIKER